MNVVFQESVFPFTNVKSVDTPLFLVLDIPILEANIQSIILEVPQSSNSQATQPEPEPEPELELVPNPAVELRKSVRTKHPPAWMNDFILSNACSYPLSSYVSYSHLSQSFRHALSVFSSIQEPTSFNQAVQDPSWIFAMKLEIAALEDNNTWSIVDLPAGKTPIGCKWIYKVKYKASEEVERYKARLVEKGFSQQAGLDYSETFSPVEKMVTVRSLIALAASNQWCIYQMDVHNAFLNGDLIEEVYMQIPEGFVRQGESKKVCKLHKSLFGLKQAPRQWNKKLTDALVQMGFTQSHYDYSLFTKRQKGNWCTFLSIWMIF